MSSLISASTDVFDLLAVHGIRSIRRQHQIVSYNIVLFVEVLPLVEFFIEPDITDAEATSLLELEPANKRGNKAKKRELKADSILYLVFLFHKLGGCVFF